MKLSASLRLVFASVLLTVGSARAQMPVMGRYVRVEIPKEKATLALAEVQVFSKDENVALKGTATQIDTWLGGVAERAIDGNTDTNWGGNSICQAPRDLSNPWWEVDLGEEKSITRIAIWNRTDAVTQRRNLDGCRVVILNAERKQMWEQTLPEPGKVTELVVSAAPPQPGATLPLSTGTTDLSTIPELKKYQEIFDKNLDVIVTEQKTQSNTLSEKYLATVRHLQEQAQKAGNLDYVLALTAELELVTKGNPVAANPERDAKFAELKGVRENYLAALKVKDSEIARKITDLAQKYEKVLSGLQAELTRKGDIDAAKRVKTEREALDKKPHIVWAKAATVSE